MNILVAIDASKATSVILKEIIERHWGNDYTIRLLYVINPGSFTSDFVDVESYVEAEFEAASMLLKKAVKQLSDNGIESSYVIIKGRPAKSILAYAKGWGADLILLGSHGHSSISTLLLGSTAKEVLRNAPCSIEIVRTPTTKKLQDEKSKVLFATDGSECSLAAARALTSGLWNNNNEIHIISVVQEVSPSVESFAGMALMNGVMPVQVTEQLEVAARQATQEARKIFESKGKPVSEEVVFGEPKLMITEAAKNWGADLIIVGSHERHGFERFIEGSVSESIALHAPCSVAVIHEPIHN